MKKLLSATIFTFLTALSLQAAPAPSAATEPARDAYSRLNRVALLRTPGGRVYEALKVPLFDVVQLRSGGTTTGAATLTGTNAFTGANSFVDGNFSIIGSGDATKIAKFEVDGITTGTTRTFTLPDATGTIPLLGATQSFTGANTFTSGGNTTFGGAIIVNNAVTSLVTRSNITQTPDTLTLETTPTSNHFLIIENADTGFDFAHAVATDPTLFIHSHNQSTTQWLGLSHDGTNAQITTGAGAVAFPNGTSGAPSIVFAGATTTGFLSLAGIGFDVAGTVIAHGMAKGIGFQKNGGIHWSNNTDATATPLSEQIGSFKALTESSATAVLQVVVASGSRAGGSIEYTVDASDATDHQTRTGKVYYQVVNKAGTETCVVSGFDGTINPTEVKDSSSIAASSGTLTYAWGVDTAPANACNLTLNAVSSLTQSTLQIIYVAIRNGNSTTSLTPQ